MKYTKVSGELSRKRYSEFTRNGILKSHKIVYKRNNGLPLQLKACCEIIWKDYLRDDLKSPFHNRAKPAFTSQPSVNVYFARNLAHHNDDFEMERTAYGTGSGTNSIGLDQRTMRIYAFFPKLIDLIASVKKIVTQQTIYKDFDINFVSVKVYYWVKNEKGKWVKKNTEWHCDVERDKYGRVKKNNSQLPGSPVLILTYGDNKSLVFRRHSTKEEYDSQSEIEIPQQSGSLFILDPRDEERDREGMHWRHMSTSNQNEHGVTFSFMFRTVQATTRVNCFTNTIVDPVVPGWKLAQLEKAAGSFSTPYYQEQSAAIQKKLASLLEKK